MREGVRDSQILVEVAKRKLDLEIADGKIELVHWLPTLSGR